MSRISREDAARIAALAKLELTGDELDRIAGELAAILGHFEVLARVDTRDVDLEAPAHPAAALRADDPHQPLSADDAFGNAPDADRAAGLFRVPRVLGS